MSLERTLSVAGIVRLGAIIGVWFSGERSTYKSRLIRQRGDLVWHPLESSEDTMLAYGLHLSAIGYRASVNGNVVLADTLGAKITYEPRHEEPLRGVHWRFIMITGDAQSSGRSVRGFDAQRPWNGRIGGAT